jgi:hypothetical protein
MKRPSDGDLLGAPMVINDEGEEQREKDSSDRTLDDTPHQIIAGEEPSFSFGGTLKRLCRPLKDGNFFGWLSPATGTGNSGAINQDPQIFMSSQPAHPEDHLFRRPNIPKSASNTLGAAPFPGTVSQTYPSLSSTSASGMEQRESRTFFRTRVRTVSNTSSNGSSSILLQQRSRPSSLTNPTLHKMVRL